MTAAQASNDDRISGLMLVAGQWITGSQAEVHSVDANSGNPLEPEYRAASLEQIDAACAAASADFDSYRRLDHAERANFLDAIARQIELLGDGLILRAMAETGLLRARLEGERGRTCNQLRLFAELLRSGQGFRTRHDEALPDREPAPRPELWLHHIPIGPVAVFGASNFPLAFSVAGGDTASALAAGCPVINKAHPAHLGTSELVARAVDRARVECDMPAGVFSMLVGADNVFGIALVTNPHICAVGFTGSRSGGLALMAAGAKREVPIPVYAEMSSINPVIMLPAALDHSAEQIADQFAASLNLGAGQFCTNPGLVFVIKGPGSERFMTRACEAIAALPAQTMLTPGIHASYCFGVERQKSYAGLLAAGECGDGDYCAQPTLFTVAASEFAASAELYEEIFGPASLVVQCANLDELQRAIENLEAQLTIAIHLADEDLPAARTLMPVMERKAGRILANGFGTGVEVAHAMVHGGPFPATSDGRSTSVGTLAIERFLRPVCYQDIPAALRP